jgi:hypothetical protein
MQIESGTYTRGGARERVNEGNPNGKESDCLGKERRFGGECADSAGYLRV